jgi:hypothetical protein
MTMPPGGCLHSHPAGQLESELREVPDVGCSGADVAAAVGAGEGVAAVVATVLTLGTSCRG